MRRWIWLIGFAPAGIGLLMWVVLTRTPAANPMLLVSLESPRADLILALGIFLSVLCLLALGPATWVMRRAQAQRQIDRQEALQERRRFLQRLDHELKNPLTAILAGLASLSALAQDPQQQAIAAKVTAETRRISRLTADLRKLSDLETLPIEHAPVDVNDLLREIFVAGQEHPDAAGRQVTLLVPAAPWPLPLITGDRDLLFLALYNLMDNALKFSVAGDTVEVRAHEDRPDVVVEVADTGPGISATDLPYVWEELYRGQSSRAIPGSGLGLAMARAIVERHRGRIDLSTRVEQGTVVTVRLPVGSEADHRPA